MNNDDARLVESVLAGNLDDYRKLVDAYQLLAEQWAFRQVGNISEAEEIAQEAFVEAYFRLDTLRQAGKFGRWLRRIVVNTAVSWVRRRKSTVRFDDIASIYKDGKVHELYSCYEEPSPHDMIEQQEREDLLRRAIDALSPAHRDIIKLFYYDDCSSKEIADRLAISVAAVSSMMYRARRRLKEEMLRMSTGQTDSRIEISRKFGEQVTQDIISVREELAVIRQLLERLDPSPSPPAKDTVEQAVKEFRQIPEDDGQMIRWGTIGAFGEVGADGAQHMAASILTMKQEEYFNSPDADDENVAVLADAFTNSHTIRIFKHLFFFGNEKNSREDIRSECNLSDEELDAALEAFLDWGFAEWKDDQSLVYTSHGMNWVITLVGMTKAAIYHRETGIEKE
ncbi:MAG: RNA polymerase sigma factor [Candidatus Poribacteria bacterium]|nr:RNA polymerase sigma factor [Candidatus Poribacteria bacterium]MDE0502651.1 RNA polymerase sigma factor [Candidatus Poribacteria bacterium]